MIDANYLRQAGIDYDKGLERFMNDRSLYETVLDAFLSESLLERAQAAFAADDRQTLQRVVHEAKGSCGSAGLDVIYDAASALVALLRQNIYTNDELTESFKRFEAAYSNTRRAVKAALGK